MDKKISVTWAKFCSEDITKIEGYDRWLNDTTDTKYHCHHRLEIELDKTRQELIDENMYFDRPASELLIMTETEHHILHNTGKHHSDEHKKKIGEALKGRTFSDETRRKLSEAAKNRTEEHRRKIGEYAKNRTEEHRRKISEANSKALKGLKWWNDGQINKRSKTCPGTDFVPGRLKYR